MELGESAGKGAARDNLEEAQADEQVVAHPDTPLIGQRKRKKEKKQEVGTGSGFDLQGEEEKKRKPIPSQTVEEVGTAAGFEVQGKKKKKKKREFSPSQTVGEVGTGSGHEVFGKRKKEKKRKPTPSQTVEEVGTVAGFEVQGKKKKKREFSPSQTVEEVGTGSGFDLQGEKEEEKKRKSTPLQIVEEVGTVAGFEVQGKKKEKKREFFPSQTVEEVGTGSGHEVFGKRKKEKKRKPTPSQTVEEVGTGNGLELQGKKEDKQKEMKRSEFTSPVTVEDVDEAGIGSGDESRRKRRKKDKSLATAQTLEDCRSKTVTAKKTILLTQETQIGNGAESVGKKKKVTFQLPDSTQDDPSENELLGEEIETMHTSTVLESSPWKTDQFRPDLVYGIYTPQEDGALKQAIFDYIQERGWDREDGLKKVLNSKSNEARGCWCIIRKCLPHRHIKRLYTRAHRLFDAGNYLGKWTPEETQSLIELHSVHGNNWKKISTTIGRDALNCKDKWRYLKVSGSNGQKTGVWSEEELQKLCALVLKCLHVRRQMAKKGQLREHHKVVRDEISWEFIAEQIDGRNRLDCMTQWYRRMASPMVTTGDWSNGDDQRLLERLTEEFPLSEELVEWDSLLEHRSGEMCKRRWEQMQRSLGRGPVLRHLHFLEKLTALVTRFAPHLADAESDPQFAAELEQADTDESEDNVDT